MGEARARRHLRLVPEPLSLKLAREARADLTHHGFRTLVPVANKLRRASSADTGEEGP